MIDNPCKWAVAFDIPGANYAEEEFIEKCLSEKTRDKFYIVNTEEIKDVEP